MSKEDSTGAREGAGRLLTAYEIDYREQEQTDHSCEHHEVQHNLGWGARYGGLERSQDTFQRGRIRFRVVAVVS